jgi:hypothetical protein
LRAQAKQSRAKKQELDCFVAALLAMTGVALATNTPSFQACAKGRIPDAQLRIGE